MTDPTTLLALAERCEQAAGVDQKAVMLAVVDALGLPSKQHCLIVRMIEIGAYESAAVTLVPEGCDWHCQSNPSVTACWASVDPMKFDLKLQEWGSGMRRASTPALALCAAALRASPMHHRATAALRARAAMAQPSSDT
jgi:hypothetical protein